MALTDPLAAVQQYIDNFNPGDGTAMAATFAVPGLHSRRNGTACVAGTNSLSGLVPRRSN